MRSAFSPTLLVTLSVVSLLFVFVTSQTPEGADLTGADIAQIENGIAQDEKKFKNAVEHFAEEVGKNLPDTDLGSISEEEYEQRKTAMLKSIESGDQNDPYVIEMMKMIQETDDIRENLLDETMTAKGLFKDLADVLASVESEDGDTYDDILSAQVEEILRDGDDMDDLASVIKAAESAFGTNLALQDDMEALGIDISQAVRNDNSAVADMTEDLDTELEQKKQNATLTATELMKQVQELMNEFTDDESGTADKLRDALMANFDKVGMLAQEGEEDD